jgi:hypothetical protein
LKAQGCYFNIEDTLFYRMDDCYRFCFFLTYIFLGFCYKTNKLRLVSGIYVNPSSERGIKVSVLLYGYNTIIQLLFRQIAGYNDTRVHPGVNLSQIARTPKLCYCGKT